MKEKKYFVCSVGDPSKGYDDINLQRCIVNNCFVLNDRNKRRGAISKIEPGDLLILKYKKHFIGYGRAISSLQTDKDFGDEWNQRVDVNLWIMGSHIYLQGIREAQESGTDYDTVKEIEREFALTKIEEIGLPF